MRGCEVFVSSDDSTFACIKATVLTWEENALEQAQEEADGDELASSVDETQAGTAD